jgi:hypothetical protein
MPPRMPSWLQVGLEQVTQSCTACCKAQVQSLHCAALDLCLQACLPTVWKMWRLWRLWQRCVLSRFPRHASC